MINDVYVAPDVVTNTCSLLAHAPHFLPGPDNLIAVYLSGPGGDQWHFDGFVTQVHHLGDLAAVRVQTTLVHGEEPTYMLYIVRAASLPMPRRYIHARIGAVCRERGISARQLADRMGVPIDRARWLMADVMDEIDTAELGALCKALGVQPADLLVVADVPPPTVLTLRQACAYFRMGRRTVKRFVKQGRLKGYKIKGQWSFDWADVVDYMRWYSSRWAEIVEQMDRQAEQG